jgi:peptidoglycan/LPS O-acetylase OafA/YrhL
MRVPPSLRLAAGWAGLVAIGAAAAMFSSGTPFPGYAALLPTVGTALVIAAGMGGNQPRPAVGRLLELTPMRIVGDRSYAFYLWHWPVLIVAGEYAGRELSQAERLGLLLGALLLSFVSYALVENPIRRPKWSGPRISLVFAASTAVVIVAAVLSLGESARRRIASTSRSPRSRCRVLPSS